MTLDLGPIKERAERATGQVLAVSPFMVTCDMNGGGGSVFFVNHGVSLHFDQSSDAAKCAHALGEHLELVVEACVNQRAASMADIPALVAEVEALRAALGAWRALATEAYITMERDAAYVWCDRFDAEAKASDQ